MHHIFTAVAPPVPGPRFSDVPASQVRVPTPSRPVPQPEDGSRGPPDAPLRLPPGAPRTLVSPQKDSGLVPDPGGPGLRVLGSSGPRVFGFSSRPGVLGPGPTACRRHSFVSLPGEEPLFPAVRTHCLRRSSSRGARDAEAAPPGPALLPRQREEGARGDGLRASRGSRCRTLNNFTSSRFGNLQGFQ